MDAALKLCLRWWLEILDMQIKEQRSWHHSSKSCAYLFCDARGEPPRVAAVLLLDGTARYTDFEPPSNVLAFFAPRSDEQIMGLELLSIALGLSTFGPLLAGRTVRVYSDNVGSEYATKRGSAKKWDHSCIVHSIWRRAVQNKASLWIERVASKHNIADLPSREEYDLLESEIGAHWEEPILDDAFFDPSAWSELSLKSVL